MADIKVGALGGAEQNQAAMMGMGQGFNLGMGGGAMLDLASLLNIGKTGAVKGQVDTSLAALRTSWEQFKGRFGKSTPDVNDGTKNGKQAVTKTGNANFNAAVTYDTTSSATLAEGIVRQDIRLGEALSGLEYNQMVLFELVAVLVSNMDDDSRIRLFSAMGANGFLAAALTGGLNTRQPAPVIPAP